MCVDDRVLVQLNKRERRGRGETREVEGWGEAERTNDPAVCAGDRLCNWTRARARKRERRERERTRMTMLGVLMRNYWVRESEGTRERERERKREREREVGR